MKIWSCNTKQNQLMMVLPFNTQHCWISLCANTDKWQMWPCILNGRLHYGNKMITVQKIHPESDDLVVQGRFLRKGHLIEAGRFRHLQKGHCTDSSAHHVPLALLTLLPIKVHSRTVFQLHIMSELVTTCCCIGPCKASVCVCVCITHPTSRDVVGLSIDHSKQIQHQAFKVF